MRQAIGIAVFAGMLGVTLFGLFLTPVFFVTIENVAGAALAPRPVPDRPTRLLRGTRHDGRGAAPVRKSRSRLTDVGCDAGCGTRSSRRLRRGAGLSASANAGRSRISRTPGEPGLAEGDPVERYWTAFKDPLARQLVEDARRHNKDLATAAANLRAARAAPAPGGIRSVSRPSPLPAATRTTSMPQQQLPGYRSADREFDTAEAGFDGLWELDLFGRVRRNVEAARADVGASEATLQDARVSVIAEVARDYFILRGLQDQLALTERNADNQLSTLKLTRTRLEAGRGNELDTSRAEAQWQTTLASIPTLRGVDRHDHLPAQRADRPRSRRHSRAAVARRRRCRRCRP